MQATITGYRVDDEPKVIAILNAAGFGAHERKEGTLHVSSPSATVSDGAVAEAELRRLDQGIQIEWLGSMRS